MFINNKYISGFPGSPWHPKDDFLNMEVSTARSDCQFPELPKIAPDGYRFAEPNNFLNYVRVHDMFSRILTFLFVIAFFEKKNILSIRKTVSYTYCLFIIYFFLKWKSILNRSKQMTNFKENKIRFRRFKIRENIWWTRYRMRMVI